jgi:RimJ/RimL family protein N-acetyltransferase
VRTIIPINNQLALTPFQATDKPGLVEHLREREIYQNTLRIPYPYTEVHADEWLAFVKEELERWRGLPTQWAIRHTEHGHVGNIGMFLHGGPGAHADEIGYWLAKPYWGRGFATAAVQALCAEMWAARPSLVRIYANVFAHNLASARVLEKAGFEREGYLRKHYLKDGQLLDGILLARLREREEISNIQ